MPKVKNPRKARFLAALRLAGMSMSEWASMHGTAQGYVSNLLAGRRSHAELEKEIEAFAVKHLSAAAA